MAQIGHSFCGGCKQNNQNTGDSKRIFSFQTDIEEFKTFHLWTEKLKNENKKTEVLIGCEPIGYYWLASAKYVQEHQKTLVRVNPFSVKKIKELDNNSSEKTDAKDPV